MTRYRRKGAEVDALVWSPDNPLAAGELVGWVTANGGRCEVVSGLGAAAVLGLSTAHGIRRVRPGDVVIRGSAGEWGTDPADQFAADYEPIEDGS